MVTAHGASERALNETRGHGLNVLEATCPLVHVAHRSLRKLVREGFHPVIIGKRDHVEVRGMTEDLDEFDVVLCKEDVADLRERPRFGVISQTTQPMEKVRRLVQFMRERFPKSEVRFIDTVCQPTKQRQNAAVEIAKKCDVVVVIGGAHSNNTHELVKTCSQFCPRVHHVQTADDLRAEWFADAETAGITAGTSTPDVVIAEVEKRLQDFDTRRTVKSNKPRRRMNWLPALLENVPDDPFYKPRKPLWLPREMSCAPELPTPALRKPTPRTALLVNPFYAKSPHGSFGKHVLTPTLALTSLAGATPAHWQVRYWDENLLQGPPPGEPLPEVVGITVHLTFAKRAYELARWYRAQGSKVILGGLHMQSCPDEVAPHADAIAIGDGVQLWPEILRDVERGELKARYEATYERPYRARPAAAPGFAATKKFFDDDQPHRHTRLPQPLRILLSVYRWLADAVSRPRTGGYPPPVRGRRPALRRVYRQQSRFQARLFARTLPRAAAAEKIWSAAVTLDVTGDPALVREMALAGCTGVFIGFESLTDQNLADARKRTPRAEDYARRLRIFHDHGIQVNGSFVVGFDGDRKDTFTTLVQWIEANRMECATFQF